MHLSADWKTHPAPFLGMGLPQGDCFRRVYAHLPGWIGLSAVFVACAWAAWIWVGPRASSLLESGSRRIASWRDAAALAAFCIVLVSAFDGRGFIHGFFRQDDFSLLQVTREVEGLGRQMLTIHNVHWMPIFRLEIWLLVKCAGAGASSVGLAAGFNALNLLVCTALIASGCWVLHESGCSRTALYAMAFFALTWPGWGEFTSGFYTLMAYLQVQAAGFCAVAAMMRGFRRGSTFWLCSVPAFVIFAIGVDVSGVALMPMVAVASLPWLARGTSLQRMTLGAGLALGVAVTLALRHAFQHTLSARELAQNPGGAGVDAVRSLHILGSSLGATIATVASAPGGILASFVTPSFSEYALTPRGASAALFATTLGLQILVLIAAGAWIARSLGRLGRGDRLLWATFPALAMVGIALVLLGRAEYGTTTPVMIWHAKYLIMPSLWMCAAVVLLADRLHLSNPGPGTGRALFAAVACGVWLTYSLGFWERTATPQLTPYLARGRWGNVETAILRGRQYDAAMNDLVVISGIEGSKHLVLSEPSRWGATFFEHYYELEWGQDYTPTGVTHLFWDLPAASPGLGIDGRWVKPEDIPADVRKRLMVIDWLGRADGRSP